MGTLGCINDMLQRDKENRELRKLSKERLKETRNRLMKIGSSTKLPDTSVEEMKEIRKKTIEKEIADYLIEEGANIHSVRKIQTYTGKLPYIQSS